MLLIYSTELLLLLFNAVSEYANAISDWYCVNIFKLMKRKDNRVNNLKDYVETEWNWMEKITCV